MKEYLKIFWAFIKVGALTFGGGYAMLPILQREVVEHNHWASEEEIMDYYAMAQCLPGIIMVNTAAFVGRKYRGKLGGIVAALGSMLPSLIIITVIAMFLTAFSDYPVVKNAFAGIRVCVVVLIVNAVVKLWKSAIVDWKCLVIIFAPVCVLSLVTDISPILFVVAAAFVGIGLQTTGVDDTKMIVFIAIMTVLGVITKVVGCGLGGRMAGFGGASALMIGAGMVPRGEMALITAQIGFNEHVLGSEYYSTIIFIISLVTLVAPLLLKLTIRKVPGVGAGAAGTAGAEQ